MEWKDINGFEGKYQISEDGRVRSIGRVVKNKCGTISIGRTITTAIRMKNADGGTEKHRTLMTFAATVRGKKVLNDGC